MGILTRIDAVLKMNAFIPMNAHPDLKQFFITGIQIALENQKQPVNTSQNQQTRFEQEQIDLTNQIRLQAEQENLAEIAQIGTPGGSSDYGSIGLGGGLGL